MTSLRKDPASQGEGGPSRSGDCGKFLAHANVSPRARQGIDATESPNDPVELVYLNHHLSEAERGSSDSASWLKKFVRAFPHLDAYAHWAVKFGFVREMAKGGLRKNSRRTGQVGKRGNSDLTDHNRLLLAREMWKFLHLAGGTVADAEEHVSTSGCIHSSVRSSSSARAAYYHFAHGGAAERRILAAELSRDFSERRESRESWFNLCQKDETRLQLALSAASQLRDRSPPVVED